MKISFTIFVILLIQSLVFSQGKRELKYFPEAKSHFKKATRYYLKKRIPSPYAFTKQYSALFQEANNYSVKDRVLALKLINRLNQLDDILFFKLMRIRLEWNFKPRLSYSPLYSIGEPLKNNTDSANYSLLLGIYFKDTLIERVARHMGYVKEVNPSVETVDWGKMNTIKWANPQKMESINHNYYNPPFCGKDLRDSSFKYYKKAIELDSTQFYYIKEFLIYLYKFGDDKEIQQLIISKMKNYSMKEKKWLKKLLDISSRRQTEMGIRKNWVDSL